jgi:glycosyltransferase involved in cell wall biosynthesis
VLAWRRCLCDRSTDAAERSWNAPAVGTIFVSRVAVLGPVEPFRSGIARHTTALARALNRRSDCDVRVYSFSRQYPALLFPGQSDRASDTSAPRDLDVSYAIDSVDPRSWWQVAQAMREYRPDVVIAPLWTFFLAPCLTAILARQRCPIVGVVHNVADHDARRVSSWVSAWPIRQASAFVTHTRELAAGVQRLVPGARVEVHPHPTFDYPAPLHALPKRADLELLMFGLIRPYKGLDVLLEALRASNKRSVQLSVVGESWQSEAALRASLGDLGGRVELVLRYVPDAEAAEYFDRSDVVALPYRSVTGSGVLPLAYHYDKPVVASDLPGFRELVVDGQSGWLVPPGDARALARCIDDRISREAAAAMVPMVREARRRLSFDHFAEALLQAAS